MSAPVTVTRRGLAGLVAAVSGGLAVVLAVPRPAWSLGAAALAVGAASSELLEVHRVRRREAVVGLVLAVVAASVVLALAAREALDLSRLFQLYLNPRTLTGLGPAFARGVWNTIQLSALAEVGGVAIGLALALVTISERRLVRLPAVAYVDLFRGTPLLVQLSFIYFGLPFIGVTLSAFQAGVVGLALNSGAYVAEIFRAGIQSVDRGQMEAARGLGMPHRAAMRYVIVPQAVRRVMPPLTNEFIALLKDSSLVAVLGATAAGRELYKVARDAYGSTFSATPFVVASLLYLLMTIPLTRVVNRMERGLRSP